MSNQGVSVILRHISDSPFLERAICSVLDQGVDALQLIVVSNQPRCQDVASLREVYRDDATWHCDESLTEVTAINWALRHASEQYVAILSSDDMLMPGCLEAAVAKLHAQPRHRWLVSSCMMLDADDRTIGRLDPQAPGDAVQFLRHDAGYLPLTGSVFERSLFEQFGMFESAIAPCFDYEFACRLLLAGEKPVVTGDMLTARHDMHRDTAEGVIARGLAFIEAARKHARALKFSDRMSLWKNCEHRRRIYALAEAELHGKQKLWGDLFRHPWWALDDSLRHAMIYGPSRQPRPAAAA